VLALCGATDRFVPYTKHRDADLTAIVNGYARPEFLPLVWEAIQLQTRRPRETWIVQNHPGSRATVPRDFFGRARAHDTVIVDSGLNHGPWFRFLIAALHCRTRFVAVLDDDTLPGREAFAAALECLEARPGVYGGRGITFRNEGRAPSFWGHEVFGWPAGTAETTRVDFVGHLWVMETAWLPTLFAHLPRRLFDAAEPGRECGEDMFLSHVAQRSGIDTFVYPHGSVCNERWSSIQAYEMGYHPAAMSLTGALQAGDAYLAEFVAAGWRLIRF
jgi:hypothetical protein